MGISACSLNVLFCIYTHRTKLSIGDVLQITACVSWSLCAAYDTCSRLVHALFEKDSTTHTVFFVITCSAGDSCSVVLSLQVNVPMVMKTMKENGEKAVKLILAAVPMIAQEQWHVTIGALQVHDHETQHIYIYIHRYHIYSSSGWTYFYHASISSISRHAL